MEDEESVLQQQLVPQGGFGGLGVPLQAVAVVGAPAFPNSVKWSQENLLAIASGHLVTILVPPLTKSFPRIRLFLSGANCALLNWFSEV